MLLSLLIYAVSAPGNPEAVILSLPYDRSAVAVAMSTPALQVPDPSILRQAQDDGSAKGVGTQRTNSAVCPVTGEAVNDESPAVAISGVHFRFKDKASKESFLKSPREQLTKANEKGWVVGHSFFDPVMHKSMILSRDGQIRDADIRNVKTWSPYGGILYPLGSPRSQNAFQRSPQRFVAQPARYSLWCPIMGKEIPSIERSLGYIDYGDARYFFCCEACLGAAQGQRGGSGYEVSLQKAQVWTPLFGK